MNIRTELDAIYEELCAEYRKQSRVLILLISLEVVLTILVFYCGVIGALENRLITAFLMFCLAGFDGWVVVKNIERFVQLRKEYKAVVLTHKLFKIARGFHRDSSEDTTISSDST